MGLPTDKQPATVLHQVEVFFLSVQVKQDKKQQNKIVSVGSNFQKVDGSGKRWTVLEEGGRFWKNVSFTLCLFDEGHTYQVDLVHLGG